MARNRSAQLDVDKVYGILGLAEAAVRENTKVDYSRSAVEVYVDFVSLWISLGGPVSFVLHFASHQPRLPGLPSWCPNLKTQGHVVPLLDKFGESRDVYAAGKHKAWSKHQSSRLCPDTPMFLNAGSFQVDTVATVINSVYEPIHDHVGLDNSDVESLKSAARQTLAWREECHALTQTVYAEGREDPLDVLQRTLIGDVLGWQRCIPWEVSVGYKITINRLSELRSGGKLPRMAQEQISSYESYKTLSTAHISDANSSALAMAGSGLDQRTHSPATSSS